MKRIYLLFLFICIHSYTFPGFADNFEKKRIKPQESLWPAIKGKWWPSADESGGIIRMQKIPLGHGYFNFFSKDSCQMENLRYDDALLKENYKWINIMNIITIYRKKDTLVLKVIKLTRNNFHFRTL